MGGGGARVRARWREGPLVAARDPDVAGPAPVSLRLPRAGGALAAAPCPALPRLASVPPPRARRCFCVVGVTSAWAVASPPEALKSARRPWRRCPGRPGARLGLGLASPLLPQCQRQGAGARPGPGPLSGGQQALLLPGLDLLAWAACPRSSRPWGRRRRLVMAPVF